ncbi:MAG: acetate--CoA ligase family protein [Syntrophales bacterium]|nr:acetate--CoA ligase family protein [Syntrophales bacterium]MDY0045254.1 acetate--CoA ligase family protein [Syntrophales bacterium]
MDRQHQMMKRLFEPRSVLVAGASREETNSGYKIISNMVNGGYKGAVYPVNPKGGRILGFPVYKRIEDIDDEKGIDLGIILVPARFVFDAIKSSAGKNIACNLIISSGFSEIGNIQEEARIARFARDTGMRIVGPNTFGIYSRNVSINCTLGPGEIKPGEVAIITQSSAIGLSIMGWTAAENIGLSAITALGNKSDVDEADLLQYLMRDAHTRVIFMYIESIGDGERFVRTLERTSRAKPVIVLKAGRSQRGAMTVASHTGVPAGEDSIFGDIMRQFGILRAESISEALLWCKFIACSPPPKGENSVIVTNSGGAGVLCTDACDEYNVPLFDNAETLRKVFTTVTPEHGSVKNPIDLTGKAAPDTYNEALDAAVKCDDIDTVIALYCEREVFSEEELCRMVQRNYDTFRKTKKVLSFSLIGGNAIVRCRGELEKRKIPIHKDIYEAVSPVGAFYFYNRYRKNRGRIEANADLDYDAIARTIYDIKKEKRFFLIADEARKIMNIAGIRVPRSLKAASLEHAVRSAEKIGYPVVMKIVSKNIICKSTAGGVALDLVNEHEVADAYEVIMKKCRTNSSHAVIEGVEIAEMVQEGIECTVTAKKDRSFGPVIMTGSGGIYAEVMKDVACRAFPVKRRDVLSMMSQIGLYPLLFGIKGEERKDIDALITMIIKLGSIVHTIRDISEIATEPVLVCDEGDGINVLDVKILLARD